MPAPVRRFTFSSSGFSWEATSSPPSVVTSCRPSGTSMRHLGLELAGDADHFVGRRHLQVELDVRQLAQPAHVLVLDVAPVLAQVHGDAVGAAEVRLDRRPHRVGLVRAPRLAHGGDVVDVDAKLDHRARSQLVQLHEDAARVQRLAVQALADQRRASERAPRRASRCARSRRPRRRAACGR